MAELGKRKARSSSRFLTLPVEHRTCGLHRSRRSTRGHSPWGCHAASVAMATASTGLPPCVLPLRQHPREHNLSWMLARSRGTVFAVYSLSSVLPQARGLRPPSSSWGRRLARPPTPPPHPSLPEALGFRWGLPSLLPTPLHIQQAGSRVRHGRLKQTDVGGVWLAFPLRALRLPRLPPG